jgi:hypothetical protein
LFHSQAEENEGERVTKKERERERERKSRAWYMKTEISFILHEE